ncbi:FAD-binding oxidoreductase [Streptomyces sp. ISL-90]|nr:FAD-binding oxidoreductase [Streptomyces sp. ISL-90]
MNDAASHSALDSLGARFGDRLTFPGDPLWDAVRSPWNLAVDQRPAAVAAPADVDELRALLEAARADGLQLAVQPSGHGASGSLEGTVLVRTSAFRDIEVDTEARVARVGAGARWGAVLEALAGSGLVPLTGTSPVVNATAFTLAGGNSWFARSFGFASSSLRAVELLTADGRHRWVRDADEPELMWALRGAGGAFGIATAIEIDLHPAPVISGGRIVFDGSDAASVFRAVAAAGRSAPDSLALHAGAVRLPDVELVPPHLRGTTVETVQLGEPGAAAAALDSIRSAGTVVLDTVGHVDVELLGIIAEEPTDPSAGFGWSALADLDDEIITRLVTTWESPDARAVMSISLRVLGGALAAPPARPGIADVVSASHLVSAHAIGRPELEAAAEQGFAALHAAIGPAASDRTLCTFLAPGVGYAGAYARADTARAGRVKATIDPEDRFRGNRDFE